LKRRASPNRLSDLRQPTRHLRGRLTPVLAQARRANQFFLSSPLAKNIPFLDSPKSVLELSPSCSVRGALAIVTDAEQDAVGADALLTNSV
jgi:hypothetical protein